MKHLVGKHRPAVSVWIACPLLLSLLGAGACSKQTAAPANAASGGAQASSSSAAAGPASPAADPGPAPSANEALERLCAQRSSANSMKDFTVGPGDLIQINVPGMDEFRNYEARVTPAGALELPLAGTVKAPGLTEQGLTDELKRKLGEYIRNPDVEVLVAQYQSRDVGVAGMVQKPGVYTLNSPSETLLDVISQAGGLAPMAASQVYFIPAQAGSPPPSGRLLNVSGGPAGELSTRQNVAIIDLSSPDSSKYMSCPARPGDVLIAPAAGSVMVQGWVRQPGSFPITPRMTVLGAVDAAGGAMFSSSVHLLRGNAGGDKTDTQVDLSKIAGGSEPDIPVESGDVVAVSGSAVGAVPYAFYTMFMRLNPGVGVFSGF
jgi:polysaccharide export outer membrane protein